MLFSSTIFLFAFLPITLIISWIMPTIRLKNFFLVIASLIFYAWGEGELVFLMLFSILMNYLFGLGIDKATSSNKKKIFLALAIIGNLGLLGYYKYFNFFIDNLNSIAGGLFVDSQEIILPIGISFFTFQSISYLIDVYRNEAHVQKDPLNLALYISLFPQLIAGPIVRYHDVFLQIENRDITLKKITIGLRRFIIGLGKKVLIANTCGRVADQIFEISSSELSGSVAWLGIICYTFQIYFDFSGYSDMAIGLGKMLGFDFLENFNFPYIAKSIKTFWRRWHISLSTWFKDYLYFPLGGNRIGRNRTYINLLIVFFLTGLWHGASWNFIVWGMLHGLFLILERIGLEKLLKKAPNFFSHLYTMFVVVIAWVFFRSDDLTSSIDYISKMFGMNQPQETFHTFLLYIDNEVIITLIIALIASMPILGFIKKHAPHFIINSRFLHLFNYPVLIGILIFSIMSISSGTHNPFIYFRF